MIEIKKLKQIAQDTAVKGWGEHCTVLPKFSCKSQRHRLLEECIKFEEYILF